MLHLLYATCWSTIGGFSTLYGSAGHVSVISTRVDVCRRSRKSKPVAHPDAPTSLFILALLWNGDEEFCCSSNMVNSFNLTVGQTVPFQVDVPPHRMFSLSSGFVCTGQVRAYIAYQAGKALAKAATIATRYSILRRQGFRDESEGPGEQQVRFPHLRGVVLFLYRLFNVCYAGRKILQPGDAELRPIGTYPVSMVVPSYPAFYSGQRGMSRGARCSVVQYWTTSSTFCWNTWSTTVAAGSSSKITPNHSSSLCIRL